MRVIGAVAAIAVGGALGVFVVTREAGTIGLAVLIAAVVGWVVYGVVTTVVKRFAD